MPVYVVYFFLGLNYSSKIKVNMSHKTLKMYKPMNFSDFGGSDGNLLPVQSRGETRPYSFSTLANFDILDFASWKLWKFILIKLAQYV